MLPSLDMMADNQTSNLPPKSNEFWISANAMREDLIGGYSPPHLDKGA